MGSRTCLANDMRLSWSKQLKQYDEEDRKAAQEKQ